MQFDTFIKGYRSWGCVWAISASATSSADEWYGRRA
jgi:hypothetical protein